jgi:hypothetical protein
MIQVSYSVEGEDANGHLHMIGYTDGSGKALNPVATSTEAWSLYAEIQASLLKLPSNWKSIQIIRTVRENVYREPL